MSATQVVESILNSAASFDEFERSVPDGHGIYGLFLDEEALTEIAIDDSADQPAYIGKSNSSLRRRDVAEHFTACKTGSSTVRRSLGALLRRALGLRPVRRDGTASPSAYQNYAFDAASEERLSDWMKKHIKVGWWTGACSRSLAEIEREVIRKLDPPLNLTLSRNVAVTTTKGARAECRDLAQQSVFSPSDRCD